MMSQHFGRTRPRSTPPGPGSAGSSAGLTGLTGLAAALVLALAPALARAIEEPRYTVERQFDGIELRDYAPRIAAEVIVPGPADEAGSQGFRILAAYIFGKNQGRQSIAMTAPVTQVAEPQKIAMTAPVTQEPTAGGYAVQFMMPAAYTLQTLPAPLDPRIRFKEVAGGRYAVIRYSGWWSDANYRQHLTRLRQAVAAAGLRTTGEPVYARYDPPWMPWFMRRNEIWLRLA
ncbi:MAG: heme-binding protein [Burkholderiales bacterium]|nr:heme-binding protein [Burkholderiales bacterium]